MNCVNQSIAQMINNTHGVNVIEICKYLNEDKLNEFLHIIKSEMNHKIIDEISKNNETEHLIQSGLDIIHEMENSNNIDNLIILRKYFSIWYKNSKEIKIKKSENDEIINSKQEEIKNSENTNDEIQQSENNEECVQMYFDFKTIEQFKTFIKNTGVKDVTVKKHLNNLHKWNIFMNNKLLVNQDLFVDILKNKDTTLSQKLSLTTTASKILQFMNLPNQNILDYMREINLKLENYYKNKNNKDCDNTISLTNNIVSENNILIRLKNQKFHVPEVFHLKQPYLILEKVHGVNLCDFINDNLKSAETLEDLDSEIKDKIIHSVEKLAEFLAQLHEKNIVKHYESEELLVLNKGDTRLRDFIINFSQDILYGVDFEEAYEGNHMDDLAWICCSMLDTDPGLFSMDEPKHKMSLINLFLRKYYQKSSSFQFDLNYLAEKLIEHLNVVIVRRNLPYGPLKKASFFDGISKDIN